MSNEGFKMRAIRSTTLFLAALAAATSALAAERGPAAEGGAMRGAPAASASVPGPANRQYVMTAKAAAKAGYKPLSELTGGAYPAFTPGIGAVYAKRELLPNGPFVAYDHKGRLVSTIYKLSMEKVAEKGAFEARGSRMPAVDHVGGHFSGSHPGVDFPHYSLVLWHVPKRNEARVAQ
jgi:hypothetical protein